MDVIAECTHCRVLMTSWAAPGSTVRYWQCPFCGHTHSSLYAEVFRSGAGARLLPRRAAPAAGSPLALPQPTPVDREWAALKARANRWFARLEAEERPSPERPPARVLYEPARTATRRPSRRG